MESFQLILKLKIIIIILTKKQDLEKFLKELDKKKKMNINNYLMKVLKKMFRKILLKIF